MKIEIAAPGPCPICGKEKLVISDFECKGAFVDMSPRGHTRAVLRCGECKSLIQITSQRGYSILRDVVVAAAESRLDAQFFETLGGFQFTD